MKPNCNSMLLTVAAAGVCLSVTSRSEALTFATPEDLGGSTCMYDGAALSSWGVNRLDAFVVGCDQNVYHKAFAGSWFGWESLGGGIMRGKPVAVSWGPNRIDIFTLDVNGNVWHMAWANGWYGWTNELGGSSSYKELAVDSQGSGLLDVFALRTDGRVDIRQWNGSSWTAWGTVPGTGPVTTHLSATSWATGRIDIMGYDYNVSRLRHDAAVPWWFGWDLIPADPGHTFCGFEGDAIAARGTNNLIVLCSTAPGLDYTLWTGSSWTSWATGLPNGAWGVNAAVSWSSSRTDVLLVNEAGPGTNELFHTWTL